MSDGLGEGGSPSRADRGNKGKGRYEGGQESRGGQGLGASKHAEEGGEETRKGETSESKNGKTWEKIRHQFPLHESRALSGIMQDIVETACNGDVVSGRKRGPGGTVQRSAGLQAGTTAKSHAFSSTYNVVNKTLHKEKREKKQEGKTGG